MSTLFAELVEQRRIRRMDGVDPGSMDAYNGALGRLIAMCQDREPPYERTGDCPTWCTSHSWTISPGREPVLAAHHADPLEDAGLAIDFYAWPDGSRTALLADGSCEDLTPDDMRRLARLLMEAADVLQK